MAPDEMRQVVDEAMNECARHRAAMDDVASIAAARAEEQHHQAAMAGMIDGIRRARVHLMMGGAGTFSCPEGP